MVRRNLNKVFLSLMLNFVFIGVPGRLTSFLDNKDRISCKNISENSKIKEIEVYDYEVVSGDEFQAKFDFEIPFKKKNIEEDAQESKKSQLEHKFDLKDSSDKIDLERTWNPGFRSRRINLKFLDF